MIEFKRHNFKKMKIWKSAMDIAKIILDVTDTFPTHEKFDLKNQMDRSAIPIPSNIAEGSRRTNKAFKHLIDIALGSSFELHTQLLLANHRKYVNEETTNKIENKIEEFQRMTMSFQNNLDKD